jgi:hypothetical protein
MALPVYETGVLRHWPESSELIIKNYSPKQCREYLDQVLLQANVALKVDQVEVVFMYHVPTVFVEGGGIDPSKNLMLGIRSNEGQEPIDILYLKALDGQSLKPQNLLVDEVVSKVKQHLAAKKTADILLTMSGSKLDKRFLDLYDISIDEEGYLWVDDTHVSMKNEFFAADRLHSYTILRFFYDEEEGKIMIVDEYDLVRQDKMAMAIDISVTVNGCFELIRPTYSAELMKRCFTKLKQISFP